MSARAQEQREPGEAPRPIGWGLVPYRFQPGRSGNPGGRPKGKNISESLRRFIQEVAPLSPDQVKARMREEGFTIGEVIALGQLMKAMSGNQDAVAFVTERTEGRVAQTQVTLNLTAEQLDAMSDEELLEYRRKLAG